MTNGMLIGVAVIMATVAGAAIALYIAGRRGMRMRTLDERPIIVNTPPALTITPITEINNPIPPPVPPTEVPA